MPSLTRADADDPAACSARCRLIHVDEVELDACSREPRWRRRSGTTGTGSPRAAARRLLPTRRRPPRCFNPSAELEREGRPPGGSVDARKGRAALPRPRGERRAGSRARLSPAWGAEAGPAALPDLRLDVPFGLDQDVDQRSIVEILRIELWGNAPLVERPPLLDLLRERGEKRVVGDAVDDLFLVVEGRSLAIARTCAGGFLV